MKQRVPPRIASWMVEHLTFGSRNDALTGDLLEEFRGGRSVTWYWRQVLVAIIVGLARELRTQWPAPCYAALCVIPAPVFSLMVVPRIMRLPFFADRWRLDWPYSTIYDLILFFGSYLAYVWAALVIYFSLFSLATKTLDLPRLARSVSRSVFVFIAIIGLAASFVALVPQHHGYFLATRRVTAVGLMLRPDLFERLDLFLTIVLSIWITLPPIKRTTATTI